MLKDIWTLANKVVDKTLDYIFSTFLVLVSIGVLAYVLVSCTS